MRTIELCIVCPHCGAEDQEIEIEIFSGPINQTWDHPGEGAEWSIVEVRCTECKEEILPEEIQDKYESTIQEKAAEPWGYEPGDEY